MSALTYVDGGSHLILHVKDKSAAMLQVCAQIKVGLGVMAKPEPDGTWSVFIHGGFGGLERVLDDNDFVHV